jgi:elongation factor G
MKDYAVEQLRTVVLLGHGGSGKTSLAEAMLYHTGATNRLGRVEEGTTVSDFDPEEIRRKISIYTSIIPCEWKDHKLNVVDAPGYTDFVAEIKGAIRAVDAALVLIDASAGIEVGTELAWGYAMEDNLPRAIMISKMDRENARFDRILDQIKSTFDGHFAIVHLPIGAQADFQGVVDLIRLKAYRGEKGEEVDIPANLRAQAEEARTQLIETAAETDDELIMKYLDGEELTVEEIERGLKAGFHAGTVVPVFCSAATANKGIQALMDALVRLFPSPAGHPPIEAQNPALGQTEKLTANPAGPLAVQIFKTAADPYVGRLTYFRVFSGTLESDSRVFNPRSGEEERIGGLFFPRGKEQIPTRKVVAGDVGAVAKLSSTVTGDTLCDRDHPLRLPLPSYPTPLYSVALFPKTQTDAGKIGTALHRLAEEDPTLQWRQEPSTKQLILSGMGETHILTALQRMESKFGVNVTTEIPKVPYLETITRSTSGSYRHKKQTGGAGQFAEVHMRLEPLPRGSGFEYVWDVFGGAISSSFQPSIEKGIKSVLEQGVLAGYPVVDVQAAVYDGKEHPVDSKDIAFQIAGREVFKQVFQQAGPVLLEPIYNVRITVPSGMTGDIMSDLNTRRGRVLGMDQQGDKTIVTAQVPLAEMQRYATDLRSMTQGRGIYEIEYSHHEEIPAHLAQGIIDQARKGREQEKE